MSDEKNQPIDAIKLFEDTSDYIMGKYPTISIFNMEELIALMIMDDDAVSLQLAPEAQTEPLEKTVERVVTSSGTASNGLIRICKLLNLYFESMRKAQESGDHKNE